MGAWKHLSTMRTNKPKSHDIKDRMLREADLLHQDIYNTWWDLTQDDRLLKDW